MDSDMSVSGGLPGKGDATPGVGTITIESLWEDRQHLLAVMQIMREEEEATRRELTAYQIAKDNLERRLMALCYALGNPDQERMERYYRDFLPKLNARQVY